MAARRKPRRARVERRSVPDLLRLGPLLTIREVAHVRQSLDGLFEGGTACADASALESIDTAGLQLLLVAARAAQQRGLKLRVTGGTQVLRDAANAVGLATQLSEAVELSR